MVTTAVLQQRALPYRVVVASNASAATLLDLDRKGLAYGVEVASGASAASRAALDARGLFYYVPVTDPVAPATRASLESQGLQYRVKVADNITQASRAALERQGVRYFVEVDSAGNSVPTVLAPYTGTITQQVMVTSATASTGASSSFTPPANSTLLAFVTGRGSTGATATNLVDSLGSTWTKVADFQGLQSNAFMVTGVYRMDTGNTPAARTVTGSATLTGTTGSGCYVLSFTGTIGNLTNVATVGSAAGNPTLTVAGVSIVSYYVRQTTASTVVVPTGYTELSAGHIQYNNMTGSLAYDLTTPGNQNWQGGGNCQAWAAEISLGVPSSLTAPVASGSAVIGAVLSTTNGTWINTTSSFTYQWLRNGLPISSATASTYTLVSGDAGANISCTVTAVNAAGSGNATSNSLGPVTSAVGGDALLAGEADGFAVDFTYATDAQRVAVKVSSVTTSYAVDSFLTQAGTSPKMVYDAAGALAWSPHNMFQQSQTLTDGNWFKENSTLTGSATAAPDGTTTGSLLVCSTTGTNNKALLYNFGIGTIVTLADETYTISVYAKAAAGTFNWIGIEGGNFNNQQSFFNVSTGALGTKNAAHTGYAITSVGNGWYRCSITSVPGTTASVKIHLHTADNQGPPTGVVGEGVYLWGVQINRGSTPASYVATATSVPKIGCALDYDPVTHAAKGLLVEPAATNIATYSEDLSNAWAIEQGTVTINNQVGPTGASTADTFTENTATGTHDAYGSYTITANTNYTVSRFYKMGTRRYATIGWSDGTNGAYAVYDLQSGVVGSSAAIAAGTLNSASIQALPNGWYRCILSGKHGGVTGYATFGTANAATITPDAFGRQSFLGTGATLFYSHAQIETGTVATSIIPTTAATVTRAADVVSVTPASINYSATAGSWWAEMSHLAALSGTPRIVGTNAAASPLYYTGATTPGMLDTTSLTKTTTTIVGSTHKVAAAFASGDRAFTADGLAAATDAGATSGLLGPTTLYFGNGSSVPMLGYISKLRYVPRRKSNSELSSETS